LDEGLLVLILKKLGPDSSFGV